MHPDDLSPPPRRVLTMQIIAGVMLVSPLMFAVLVFVLHAGNPPQPAGEPWLSYVAVAMLAVQTPLAILLPRFQEQAALRRIADGTWTPPPEANPDDYQTLPEKLLAVRQTGLIIRLTLFESFGFMGCIAYLIEGHPLALVVIGLSIISLAATFPTTTGLRSWLEHQASRVDELRG